jgi:hypothetical protein
MHFASEKAVFKSEHLKGNIIHLCWYQRLWCIKNGMIRRKKTNASLPRENR